MSLLRRTTAAGMLAIAVLLLPACGQGEEAESETTSSESEPSSEHGDHSGDDEGGEDREGN